MVWVNKWLAGIFSWLETNRIIKYLMFDISVLNGIVDKNCWLKDENESLGKASG